MIFYILVPEYTEFYIKVKFVCPTLFKMKRTPEIVASKHEMLSKEILKVKHTKKYVTLKNIIPIDVKKVIKKKYNQELDFYLKFAVYEARLK